MARPNICGRCGALMIRAKARGLEWDEIDRVWTGFLDCPRCGAAYVFIEEGKRPVSLPLLDEAEP